MEAIVLHSGDDKPSLYFRIYDQDNACYVDLSAATTTIAAKFRAQASTTVLQIIACVKVHGGKYGWVRMDWPATALDVADGRYEIEVAVSFNGDIETANRYYMKDTSYDDDDVLPIRVKEDF
jgi:hypothetical protein